MARFIRDVLVARAYVSVAAICGVAGEDDLSHAK